MTMIDSAVIIGGTSGIGRAIALRFAQDGAALVIVGRDAARGEAVAQQCVEAGAVTARFVAVDVGDPASVAALADAATPVHLVGNAELCALYAQGLTALGVASRTHPPDVAARGLARIAAALA